MAASTLLSVIDYGVQIYMYSSAQSQHSLDTVYHRAPRFIANNSLITVFSIPGWDGNHSTRHFTHSHIFIYKLFVDLLPPCQHIIHKPATKCSLHSQDWFLLSVPRGETELGKKGLSALCPCRLESASGRAVCWRAALFEHF